MLVQEIKNRFTDEVEATIEYKEGTVNKVNKNLKKIKLVEADLTKLDLSKKYLREANFFRSNLSDSDFSESDLQGADFTDANLSNCNFTKANLKWAILSGSNCKKANFGGADLSYAKLVGTCCSQANFLNTILTHADLKGTYLFKAKGLYKVMGIEPGNVYWKRFNPGLKGNDCHYQYKLGINCLENNTIFNKDEREMCTFPGFHFGSKSWCSTFYPNRPLEARIKIPKGAKINEPWATDGTASSDKIEILQVFDSKTGEDITYKFKELSDNGKIRAKLVVKKCPYCKSEEVIKNGKRKNKEGISHRYYCSNCKKEFSKKFIPGIAHNPEKGTSRNMELVQMVINCRKKNMTYPEITKKCKEKFGFAPCSTTICSWLPKELKKPRQKYSKEVHDTVIRLRAEKSMSYNKITKELEKVYKEAPKKTLIAKWIKEYENEIKLKNKNQG